MPRKLYTDIAIIECLEQYGNPMTAQEITELTGRNPGTVSGRLSMMVAKGRVQVVNMGRMPRLYIKAPPIDEQLEALREQLAAPSQDMSPVFEEPDFTDPPEFKTAWDEVADQWMLVFGVAVTGADCELMVKLANRHVG